MKKDKSDVGKFDINVKFEHQPIYKGKNQSIDDLEDLTKNLKKKFR